VGASSQSVRAAARPAARFLFPATTRWFILCALAAFLLVGQSNLTSLMKILKWVEGTVM
jgi:hypothetical protein